MRIHRSESTGRPKFSFRQARYQTWNRSYGCRRETCSRDTAHRNDKFAHSGSARDQEANLPLIRLPGDCLLLRLLHIIPARTRRAGGREGGRDIIDFGVQTYTLTENTAGFAVLELSGGGSVLRDGIAFGDVSADWLLAA